MIFAKHWKHCASPLSPFCVLSVSLGVTSLRQQSRPFSLSSDLALITQSSLEGAANVRTITHVLRGSEHAENHDHVPESLSVCTLGSTCTSSVHSKDRKLQNLKNKGWNFPGVKEQTAKFGAGAINVKSKIQNKLRKGWVTT